jgi:hypothetical protein
MMKKIEIPRLPIVALGGASLITAILGGLLRIGVELPVNPGFAVAHAPLMICGFLGTVISLERVVAMEKNWFFLGPISSGVGGVLLMFNSESKTAQYLILFASVILVIVFIKFLLLQQTDFIAIMGISTIFWTVGVLLWIWFQAVHLSIWWWLGFLLLTITGERLELGRLLMHSKGVKNLLLGGISIFILGLVITLFQLDLGIRILGLGMLLIALWLIRFDMARKTIKQAGLPRFIAVNLLIGNIWLLISGVLALSWGENLIAGRYDTVLHTFFLGFVISMIFGHAPVILPAVLRVTVEFKGRFYLHVAALHISIIIRVIGNLSEQLFYLRQWGGILNGLTILLFLISTISAVSKPVGWADSALLDRD